MTKQLNPEPPKSHQKESKEKFKFDVLKKNQASNLIHFEWMLKIL